jgi:hypothetical protein
LSRSTVVERDNLLDLAVSDAWSNASVNPNNAKHGWPADEDVIVGMCLALTIDDPQPVGVEQIRNT